MRPNQRFQPMTFMPLLRRVMIPAGQEPVIAEAGCSTEIMKDFKPPIIVIYLFATLVLYLFLEIMSSAYSGSFNGKPLPLLTEEVFTYAWFFPVSTLIPITLALYYRHKKLSSIEHSLTYFLVVFSLAVILFSIALIALPLPFMKIMVRLTG